MSQCDRVHPWNTGTPSRFLLLYLHHPNTTSLVSHTRLLDLDDVLPSGSRANMEESARWMENAVSDCIGKEKVDPESDVVTKVIVPLAGRLIVLVSR